MGCFHSIPSRVPGVKSSVISSNPVDETPRFLLNGSSPNAELHEVCKKADDDELMNPSENGFFGTKEADSDEVLSVSVTSPDRFVRSDIAEDTASRSGDSVDALGDTETPDPIVSPNPVSPSQAEQFSYGEISNNKDQLKNDLDMPPFPNPTPAGSIRFSVSPLPPDSARKTSASPPPIKSSRLMDTASLRNSRLCLQVFGVWRSDVLKTKVETLKTNLDMAGKASEIILTENDHLKTRLNELENQIQLLRLQQVPAPKKIDSIAVQTDTQTEAPVTPQKLLQDVSNFVTPPSAKSQLMSSAFITPPEEPRRNWESLVPIPNASMNPPFPVRPSPIPVSVSTSPQSEKFRQISNDIARLTESIGKFELKKTSRTPVTSAVTPSSYTYTP